jgi:hypothetical protein
MEEAERVFLPIVEAFDQAVASEAAAAAVPAVAVGGTGR